jgi:cytochrome c oxidase subunit 4
MSSTVVSKKLLVSIWAALLVLLVLTWGLAQMDLHHFNVAAALTIALLKMLLVILVFMHVKYKPPLTWIFVAAGFIWLLIMIDLSLSDYMSRGSVPGVPDKTWKHDAWPAPAKEQPGAAPRAETHRRFQS